MRGTTTIRDRDSKGTDQEKHPIRAYIQLSLMRSPHPGGFMSKNLSGHQANTNRWIHFLKAESKRAVHGVVVKTDQHCRAIKCHDGVTPTHRCRHMQEPIRAAETSAVYMQCVLLGGMTILSTLSSSD